MTNKQSPARNPTDHCLPKEIEGFDSLAELALDLRWSWNHCADEAWRRLDPELWELTQNPWVVLQTVAKDKLQRVLADPAFPWKSLAPRSVLAWRHRVLSKPRGKARGSCSRRGPQPDRA